MTEPKWVDIPKDIHADHPAVVSGCVRLAEVQKVPGQSSCQRCVYYGWSSRADLLCPYTPDNVLFCSTVEFKRNVHLSAVSYIFLDAAPQTTVTPFPRGKSLRASLRRPP